MLINTNILTNLKKSSFIFLLLCVVTLAAISKPAYAQISEFKITASDGAAADFFGWSVSISGDYAVVGAFGDDDNGEEAGSAYIFKRNGTFWAQEAKLLPSDGEVIDRFGFSVSISGDYTIVGAPNDDDNGTLSGSAYVYKRTGTSWAQEAKLLPADGAAIDEFGRSVSISGDYAVVGAWRDDDNGFGSGSAYLFHRSGTSWEQEAKLLPSDGAAADRFGGSVSISGDYAVVGARGDDDNGSFSGSAYVFKRTGTSWEQEAKLLPSDGAAADLFGVVSISGGDYAVGGARLDDDNGDNSGSAYLYYGFVNHEPFVVNSIPDVLADENFGSLVVAQLDTVFDDLDLPNDSLRYTVSVLSEIVTATVSDDTLWIFSVLNLSGIAEIVVSAIDNDSLFVSDTFSVSIIPTVGIKNEIAGLPTEYSLSQNYPNPFNPTTVIKFALPTVSKVSLIIYNLRGEEVSLLINETKPAGNYRVSWDGSKIASGIYFYRIAAGDFVLTRKMVLLK